MTYFTGAPAAIVLEDALGPIWLEDVRTAPTFLFASRLQSALTARDCAGVTLARCSLLASVNGDGGGQKAPPGLAATRSRLALRDTTVVGAKGDEDNGLTLAQAGGHGVVLDGGTLLAAGGSLTGGGGGARLGRNGADGGDGLVLLAGLPLARLLDAALLGGAGGPGNGPGTMMGSAGAPSRILSGSLATLAGTARSFLTGSPVRAGSALTETFTGEPGDVVVLAYSLAGPLVPVFVPSARGSLLIAPPLIALVKGTLDAAGQLVVQPSSTALAPGAEALPVALQGAMLSATGQGVFLTGPSFLTLLDPSF